MADELNNGATPPAPANTSDAAAAAGAAAPGTASGQEVAGTPAVSGDNGNAAAGGDAGASIVGDAGSSNADSSGEGAGSGSGAAGDAADTKGAVKSKAPEQYNDFKLPEGVDATASKEAMDAFKELAKSMDLSQEDAQKLVDYQGTKINDLIEKPYKAWAETQAAWTNTVKTETAQEFGGYDKVVNLCAEVFNHKLPNNPIVRNAAEAAALRQALNMTGAGNNPAIVQAFARLGKTLSEPGKLIGGGNAPAPLTPGERIYGKKG